MTARSSLPPFPEPPPADLLAFTGSYFCAVCEVPAISLAAALMGGVVAALA